MSKNSFIVCLILTVILAAFFLIYPKIDIQVAQHFYVGHRLFIFSISDWAFIARKILYYTVDIMSLILLLLLVVKLCLPKSRLRIKPIIYILCVFILIPLAMVNGVFKDHFHRPRPRDTVVFDGSHQFQSAWVISNECSTNCSFVCGDAAVAYAFWAFLPFFRRRKKGLYGTLIFLIGSFYGYIRIGQGGHFLSDVVFACLLTYLGVWLVYWFFYQYSPKWLSERHLENGCIRIYNFFTRKSK